MATLQSLPTELHIEILRSSADLRSLASLIFSWCQMYQAFLLSKDSILEDVFFNDLPLPSLLLECQALLRPAPSLGSPQATTSGPASDVRSCIVALCTNQRYVAFFSTCFIEDHFPPIPASSDPSIAEPEPPSPSRTEVYRIQRALYRLWNLARVLKPSRKKAEISAAKSTCAALMQEFSNWEMEELKIVCECLHQRLIPLFIECGQSVPSYPGCDIRECFLNHDESTANPWMLAHFATAELSSLHELFAQKTAAARGKWLSSYVLASNGLSWEEVFEEERLLREDNQEGPPDYSFLIRYPPRHICTHPGVTYTFSDEIGEFKDGVYVVKDEPEVRPPLAIWDDERLERLGYYLPVENDE
ncbi:hypothetical protein FN846DRAFT_1018729 [Sphaerosporella brunnea]|uniref:Uncharacterized protein n=1 Tax=Sphaerosporella brunnea TaxID=1250544 RepID=A0A5J5F8R7_9PEZI|nr:hypothetical protein FN846DRAFT_1018729 [Sphaerosporella brunnea]